jgi:hypothetical protein
MELQKAKNKKERKQQQQQSVPSSNAIQFQ